MTQPTHDEVIAWIDKQIETRKRIYDGIVGTTPESLREYHDAGIASLLANRDVLVRHGREGMCNECSLVVFTENGVERCKTYLDIAQRLDEVM